MQIKDTFKDVPLPNLEKEILIGFILKKDKSYLYSHPEYDLSKPELSTLNKLIRRRLKGEPIQYLTGTAYFYGLEFFVDKRVLIPRPETEEMVIEGLNFIKNSKKKELTVVDVGTGSGNIIISIAKNLPKNKAASLFGVDISKKALAVARLNAQRNKVAGKIKFLNGDLLSPIDGKIDLVTANLPYVRPHLYGVLDPQITWEPKIAILGGDDGMKYYQRLFNSLSRYLNSDAQLLYEIDGRIYKKSFNADLS